MSIAITDDHKTLADTASEFLLKRRSRAAARALLEGAEETRPEFWSELADLGWLGLHLPEKFGGSGYGMPELVVVVEEMGRGIAPGGFVPTVIASAVINAAAQPAEKKKFLPGLADGTTTAAVALGGNVKIAGGKASGSAGVVLGAALADLLVVKTATSIAIVDARADGVRVTTPQNIDPTRTASRVTLDNVDATVIRRGARTLLDYARLIIAAEAVGVARETTVMAAEYAKVRTQFGRPIAVYQGVKHHCANMLVATELATCAVWDAARAADHDAAQFSLTAAIAAGLALPAADMCVNLNQQVHGGIGFTWEHDAHLYMRRATALESVLNANDALVATTDLTRTGVKRSRNVDLPPEAEPIRAEVQAFVNKVKGLAGSELRDALIAEGYAMPHWPKPWGRGAGAIEQLVIEQEFGAAGVKKPQYGITGWVILTLIQYATEDQVARFVKPALRQEAIWCQLFSEPDAGSDAAGIKTKATRVDGGWLVNGQKVWTSGAHASGFGLATVRTNPAVPKHDGITTMVIDMHAEGVEVRRLKMPTGNSEFNEVFFNDVFVPDDDVVGPVDGGWTVARATLGNESVSIGGGQGGGTGASADLLIPALDANPERLAGGAVRIGRYLAINEAMAVLNLRSAHRAVAGVGPGAEGAITKLVLSEQGHEAAAMLTELNAGDAAFLDGPGMMSGMLVLMHRGMSIAGGTSEIKRNQIGERILGLPRDPLLR